MVEVIAGLAGMAAATGAAGVGYLRTKSFVAKRLRYVDGVHSRAVPLMAGAAATAVAAPVVWVLPVIGAGTALAFGVAVAIGTRAGVRQIRRAAPGY